jgi:hypothetical protein
MDSDDIVYPQILPGISRFLLSAHDCDLVILAKKAFRQPDGRVEIECFADGSREGIVDYFMQGRITRSLLYNFFYKRDFLIQKPRHTSFNKMKQSIKKLFDVIDFAFDVRILGGEPFMNPEFYKFINLFRDYSSKFAYMWVITNGTIIPDEQNLEALKNEKIFVRISEYQNPKQKIEKLVETLVKNGIFHEIVPIQAWQDCARIQDYHRTRGENEPY